MLAISIRELQNVQRESSKCLGKLVEHYNTYIHYNSHIIYEKGITCYPSKSSPLAPVTVVG